MERHQLKITLNSCKSSRAWNLKTENKTTEFCSFSGPFISYNPWHFFYVLCILHWCYYLVLIYVLCSWLCLKFEVLEMKILNKGRWGKLNHGPHSQAKKKDIRHLNSVELYKVIHWWLVYSKNGPSRKQKT